MVTRKRLRSILTTLGLYVMAALLIGYFGVNAYSGNHGLKAKEDLDQQIAALSADLDRLKPERAQWERRVALLRADRLDPDMLDEQARKLLDDVAPSDLTLMFAWGPKAADAPTPSTCPGYPQNNFSRQCFGRLRPSYSPSPIRQVGRFRHRAISAMGCGPPWCALRTEWPSPKPSPPKKALTSFAPRSIGACMTARFRNSARSRSLRRCARCS